MMTHVSRCTPQATRIPQRNKASKINTQAKSLERSQMLPGAHAEGQLTSQCFLSEARQLHGHQGGAAGKPKSCVPTSSTVISKRWTGSAFVKRFREIISLPTFTEAKSDFFTASCKEAEEMRWFLRKYVLHAMRDANVHGGQGCRGVGAEHADAVVAALHLQHHRGSGGEHLAGGLGADDDFSLATGRRHVSLPPCAPRHRGNGPRRRGEGGAGG